MCIRDRIFIYPYGDIEVISAKADKGIAIRKAADQLGIDPAQIRGIGDSVNDLPMFEGCGLREMCIRDSPRPGL